MGVIRHSTFVVAGAMLAATACSGDDTAASTTTAPPPTTSPTTSSTTSTPPTTNRPTTSTEPPATTATSEPATASTPPRTTSPTLPDDLDQVRRDVIDATIAAWQAFTNAARQPTDEVALTTLAETNTGPSLERRVARVAEIAASGLVAVEHPEFPASIDVYEDTVIVDLTSATASVEYCRVGSDLGVKPGGNADGSDQIVIDEVNAYHERADLTFDNGVWLDTDGVLVELFSGESTCDG